LETVNNLPVHSVNYLTGLYRLCPPKGSYEFAEVLRVSEAYFAGRAESSAPTSFKRVCLNMGKDGLAVLSRALHV
ncbi:hypothetical protein, partial [Oscillospiraceae bacterium]